MPKPIRRRSSRAKRELKLHAVSPDLCKDWQALKSVVPVTYARTLPSVTIDMDVCPRCLRAFLHVVEHTSHEMALVLFGEAFAEQAEEALKLVTCGKGFPIESLEAARAYILFHLEPPTDAGAPR